MVRKAILIRGGKNMRTQLFKMILLMFIISLLGCNDTNKNINSTKGMLPNVSSTKATLTGD